jgi:hypothetical protein
MLNKKVVTLICFDKEGQVLDGEPINIEVQSFNKKEIVDKSKDTLGDMGLPIENVYSPSLTYYQYETKEKAMLERTIMPIVTKGQPLKEGYKWTFIKDMSTGDKETLIRAFEEVYKAGGFPNMLNPTLYTDKLMRSNS